MRDQLFQIQTNAPNLPVGTPHAAEMTAETTQEAGDRKRTSSEESEHEFDVHYPPVITLPEVVIPTNEEDEQLMLKLRAKLYRWDAKTEETPEWKERGTGEVKILKNTEHKTARIVMRRDKTLKVCANHFITPYMDLKPSLGSEKAFIYRVADFADEQIKFQCCAIRFGSVDFAKQFKETFYEAKEYVAKECALYNKTGDSSDDDQDEGEIDKEKSDGQDDDQSAVISEKLSELDVSKGDASF